MTETKFGYCKCGCGNKTNLAPKTITKQGIKKGQPINFIHGHQNCKVPFDRQTEITYGVIEGEEVCFIPITKGKLAIVDKELAPEIIKHKWHSIGKGYGARMEKGSYIYLHRIAMGNPDPSIYVDHINRNIIDNRRSNLRLATNAQNQLNVSLTVKNTSGYKGVSKIRPDKNIWNVHYSNAAGEIKTICGFKSPEEAALAYDNAMVASRGNRAVLNFPREGFQSIYKESPKSLANKI